LLESKTLEIAIMSENYNVYCDESCHLLGDEQEVMVLGAVWCPVGEDTLRKSFLSVYGSVMDE